MRTSIVLTIYVSLTGVAFAQSPPAVKEIAVEWVAAHEAGMAANDRGSFDEARVTFERSWAIAGTPEEQGSSAHDPGQTLRRIGRGREARQWLERAYELWRGVPRAGSRLALAAASLADLDRSEGDYAGAERILRGTLAGLAGEPGAGAIIQVNLAELLREEGNNEEARTLFERAIGEEGISWKLHISALVGLADLDRQNAEWDASASRWNEAIKIAAARQDNLAEAVGVRGLATMWLDAGNTARAEPLFRRALRMLDNDTKTPPEQLAAALSGLAEFYRFQNKLSLAEDAWSRALQIERKELGETHPQVACLLENLADVYSARGEFSLARDYSTRASEMLSASFGGDSLQEAAALTNRALVETRASDLNAAAKDYERAIGIARAHPENRPLAAMMIQRYASLLKLMHRSREAKALNIEARMFRPK
jgi:tetratricopeptide (TPR) repeat protein